MRMCVLILEKKQSMTPFLRFVMYWSRDLFVKDFSQLHNYSSIVIHVLNIKLISHTFVESIHIICLRANVLITRTSMMVIYIFVRVLFSMWSSLHKETDNVDLHEKKVCSNLIYTMIFLYSLWSKKKILIRISYLLRWFVIKKFTCYDLYVNLKFTNKWLSLIGVICFICILTLSLPECVHACSWIKFKIWILRRMPVNNIVFKCPITPF